MKKKKNQYLETQAISALPRTRNKKLDSAIHFLNGLHLSNTKPQKSNISKKKQWEGINDLKNNDSIIINEADKGGCVVIMNKSHYMTMVYSQLDDGITYKSLSMSSDKTILDKVIKAGK